MNFKQKYFGYLLFFITIISVSYYYNYHDIFFKRPDSIHTWRQTDCTSLALNYHQLDMPFLQPRMHNQMGNEGKCVGEFPIIYWIVGQLYGFFGAKEFIFRLFNTLIFFIGLWYLFRLGMLVLKDVFYAIMLVIVAFASPIVAFYANNFLPDVPAMSMSYIALFYLYRYFLQKLRKDLFLGILFFSIAGLLKVTALIPLCALICVVLFEWIFRKKEKRIILSSNFYLLYILAVPFVIFIAWLLYAQYYQRLHHNIYFSLDWDPFWIETKEHRQYIWQRLTSDWGWWPDFYSSFLIFTALASLLLLVNKKVNYAWRIFIAAYVFGVALFVAFYYSALNHHDYYTINLLPVFVFLILFWMINIQRLKMRKSIIYIFKALLLILCIQSIIHTKQRMDYRYHTEFNEAIRPFYAMSNDYLDSLGIIIDEKIYYDGDDMYNGVFYIINRFGWSRSYEQYDKFYKTPLYKDKGVRYFFVLGAERAQKEVYKDLKLLDIFQEQVYIFKKEY